MRMISHEILAAQIFNFNRSLWPSYERYHSQTSFCTPEYHFISSCQISCSCDHFSSSYTHKKFCGQKQKKNKKFQLLTEKGFFFAHYHQFIHDQWHRKFITLITTINEICRMPWHNEGTCITLDFVDRFSPSKHHLNGQESNIPITPIIFRQ